MNDILQYMYQSGLLTSKELVSLRKTCRELNENPVRVLRSLNVSSPDEIQMVMQRFYRIPAVTDKLIDAMDESFKALIPIDLALHYGVFAVAEDGDALHIAMEDPSDKGLIHRLEFFLEKRIVPVSATVYQIAQALNKLYELSPEQLKLTTVIESSRGVVAGVKKAPPAQTPLPEVTNLSKLASNFSPNGALEDNAVQSLTERAMAATPPAESLDFEEEGIAAPQSASQADPLDDIAQLETQTTDNKSQTLPQQATSSTTDLFEELSSPEVLGGGAKAAPADLTPGDISFFDDSPSTPTSQSAVSADLTPGDIAFFDDSSSTPATPNTTPQANPTPAVQATKAVAALNDSLDSSLGESLDANSDSDLGPIASMDTALDDNALALDDNALALDDNALALDDNALALDDNKDSSELSQDLNIPESAQESADPQEELCSVPGLSEAMSTDTNPLINNEVTQETLLAAEQLLANDSPIDESLLTEDLDFSSDSDLPEAPESLPSPLNQEVSQQTAAHLTTAVNALLVKLAMLPSRAKGLETINQKMAPLNLEISLKDDQTIAVAWQGNIEDVSFGNLELKKEQSRLIELLFPLLKKLEKLR